MTLVVRVDTDDTRSADMLKQDGYWEGDELVTYIRDVGQPSYRSNVRPATPEDVDEVVRVANDAFRPKDKTQWVREAFSRADRQVVVAERPGGGIAGFVIARAERDAVVIDLIGVAEKRAGYGAALVDAVCRLKYGKPYIQAGTQAKNEVAREFYRSLGFIVKHRRRTFHKP